MDRGAWQATVHGVAKRWTRLSDFTFLSQIPLSDGAQPPGAWRECLLVSCYLLSSQPGQNLSAGPLAPRRSERCLSIRLVIFLMSNLASWSVRFLFCPYYKVEIIASTLQGCNESHLPFDWSCNK